jgi:Resolvase, N terminal domain
MADAWADTTAPHGRLLLTVLGGLAEFERELIRARTDDGRKRARAWRQIRGVRLRSRAISVSRPYIALADGAVQANLARSYGVSQATISRLAAPSPFEGNAVAVQEAELSTMDALRVVNVGSTRYIRGKTPLNDLLAAGAVAQNVQTAFVQAYAANGGRLGPTWKTLRADKSLATADLTTLNTVLSAGELLTGNLPLVKDTLKRLADKSLASLKDLALLDEADWEARIRSVDPDATRAYRRFFPMTPPQTGSRGSPKRCSSALPDAIPPRPSSRACRRRIPRPSRPGST